MEKTLTLKNANPEKFTNKQKGAKMDSRQITKSQNIKIIRSLGQVPTSQKLANLAQTKKGVPYIYLNKSIYSQQKKRLDEKRVINVFEKCIQISQK